MTSRPAGRRARRSATAEATSGSRQLHAGRRFEQVPRYGLAPEQTQLAERFSENVIALSSRGETTAEAPVGRKPTETLQVTSKSKSRRGFIHTAAAVAAVSGLALAAVTPQLAGNEPDPVSLDAQRTATSAVMDVNVPDGTKVEVQRAALTSDQSEESRKEERFTEVLTASSGDITSAAAKGLLTRPLDSNRITSPFGHRKNPTGPGYMSHSGLDYGVACGTPVKAAASGTVTVSGWAGHSGKRVTLSHGNGLETGYSHNSSLIAKVGQKVERGEVIALSGTTGNSTGCHVHFEVIVDGKFQNPAGWL